jgi:coronin-1B/1C/6
MSDDYQMLMRSFQADTFQPDLFPDCLGPEPSMTADEYFSGKNAAPKLISLAEGYKPPAPKEFVVSAAAAADSPPTTPGATKALSDKEVQDLKASYGTLLEENKMLKARVTELERENQKMVEQRFASMSVNGGKD